MFDELKKLFDEMDKTVNKEAVNIVPSEVILKVDENGNATIKVAGRCEEVFNLIGDALVDIAQGDKQKINDAISAIHTRIKVKLLVDALKKSEDGE